MDRYLLGGALGLKKQEQGYGYLDAEQLRRAHWCFRGWMTCSSSCRIPNDKCYLGVKDVSGVEKIFTSKRKKTDSGEDVYITVVMCL